jgi:hypothetical protein
LDNFDVSQYLKDLNTDEKRGICITCSKQVNWNRERVASHKRANCPNVSEEERLFFAQRKVVYDENSGDVGSSKFI